MKKSLLFCVVVGALFFRWVFAKCREIFCGFYGESSSYKCQKG